MKLSGLHVLLTYQCTFECAHYFLWGSPRQKGTFTLEQIENVLKQAKEAGIDWIYFEGGEPFLYYAILTRSVELAASMGFHVGVVTNGYWAHSLEDAVKWLKPLAALEDISVSSDQYHYNAAMSKHVENVVKAAERLNILVGVISVAPPEDVNAAQSHGQIPSGASAVLYRGRAARELVPRAELHPYQTFTACPHEDFHDPGRVHLDPLGNLHVCQGIVIGNLFEQPLKKICDAYDADAHPVCGPLSNGGPLALIEEYQLPHEAAYADACHACYSARLQLRKKIPNILGPDQMYGVNS